MQDLNLKNTYNRIMTYEVYSKLKTTFFSILTSKLTESFQIMYTDKFWSHKTVTKSIQTDRAIEEREL